MTPEECLEGFDLLCCDNSQGESRAPVWIEVCQTWVRLWTLLVPSQCPKGDVVGSRLPSLWASIPLFAGGWGGTGSE